MILSNAAIKNRVTIAVLIVLIIVGGVYSYITLPREAAPDVPIPFVLVSTSYEGVSPEDIESSVTMKIEKKLTGLKGIKEIRSSSAEGLSLITVEFQPDIRIEDALQYVRDRVDQAKGELPTDVKRKDPIIKEINIAEFPILMLSVSGDISQTRLKEVADELQDEIERIDGVLSADVLGALEREIRLEVDPDRVASFGLTIPELMLLIPSENVNISAGSLETPGLKFSVRVPAEITRPDEVDFLPLTTRDGKTIFLSDVAHVSDTFKDRASYSRLDRANSITISIRKTVGANIVTIADRVQMVLAEARKIAPQGVRFDMTLDRSEDIRSMIADLENNMAAAFILVLAILLVTMGWRAATVVALAVPLSMLMSFAVIQMMGYTLNMIVLFSLVLAVGMLVDNAIVITENIYRHRQIGYGRIEAAMKGTAEVAWPVITSTLTTIAAFMPLLFWPGIVGDFMSYLPITVIIVLSCSLLVALVISPVICTLIGVVPPKQSEHPFLRGYRWMLRGSLSHRFTTLSLAFLLLAGMGVLYYKAGHGLEFFPSIDPKNAFINIRSPQGTNITESNRLAMLVEERLIKHQGEVRHVVANVGAGDSGAVSFGGGASGPHVANLTLMFQDYEDRPRPSDEVIAQIRDELSDLSAGEIKVEKEKGGPPTGAPVTIRIIGKDFRQLQDISRKATAKIADVAGLVNLRSDFEATKPELVFTPDRRRALLFSLNTTTTGNFLKTAIFGSKVGTYRQFNDEYDITVRLPLENRTQIDEMFQLRVPNILGDAIPLSSLGSFSYRGGLGTINRVDQKRVITLTADAEGRLPNDVLKDVQARLAQIDMPAGYHLEYAGEKEEQDKAANFLLFAFLVALLLIVMILVAQFNTLTVPLIIMTTVVLSLIGVFAGLLIYKMPFSLIMTGIGVISLAGVVVNNAIVLLDYTRQLQARGMDLLDAAVEAGATRLRPVLLTATTTIMALVPTALGMSFDFHTFQWAWKSESSLWWKPMAVAVIYGLGAATVLTLVVVPALYVSIYRIAARCGLGGVKKLEAAAEGKPKVESEDY